MPKFYLEVMKELALGKKSWEGNKTGQKAMRVAYSCIGQTHEENVDFRKDFFREVLPFLDEIFGIIFVNRIVPITEALSRKMKKCM